MVVGVLVLHLRLPGCHSLKEKRHAIRGPIERLRRGLGIALAEVGDNDLWGNATIGCACVGPSQAQTDGLIDAVLRAFDDHPEIEVDGYERDAVRY